MRKLVWCLAAVVGLSGIALGDTVCVNTILTVTAVPGLSFTCGGLTFSNFYLTGAAGVYGGALNINSVTEDNRGVVTLQEAPNLIQGGGVALWFTVTGTINSIDLAAGGTSTTVTERACANGMVSSGSLADLCSNASQTATVAPLGELTIHSMDPMQQVAPYILTSGPTHIVEQIESGNAGSAPWIYQGFGDPPVPEPVTFVLLGSALAFLGLVGRRRFHSNQ
jgi:hypothetical protein